MSSESEALRWLYSLADQERGVGWNPRASPEEQWKLGRTRALLDIAGAPDRRLRIALVAGTKGKGSTCAMLASILSAAGKRCGLYTKPHLQSYRERIRIDGQAIDPYVFEAAAERMRSHMASLMRYHPTAGEPTTFEVTTAMALDEFARQDCQMAVVEVGLGGRLDATNAVEPFVSVITPISYDHTAILGHTLAAIATEKAGILRAGRTALLARQRPAAMLALQQTCRHTGAICHVVAPFEPERELALAGPHQQQNAALAAAAARVMAGVADEVIDRGLERVRWPGRFEILEGRPPIVLDGAHNGASAEAFAATLATYAAGRPILLIIGINRDKDARAVLRPLFAIARSVWATQTQDNPRALDATELGRLSLARHFASERPRRNSPHWLPGLPAPLAIGAGPVHSHAAPRRDFPDRLPGDAATEPRSGGRVVERHVSSDVRPAFVRVEPSLENALHAATAEAIRVGGVVGVTGSLMLVGQARSSLGLAVPERIW